MAAGSTECLRIAAGVTFPVFVLLTGCGQDNRYVAPPPPKVAVMTPVEQPITRYSKRPATPRR